MRFCKKANVDSDCHLDKPNSSSYTQIPFLTSCANSKASTDRLIADLRYIAHLHSSKLDTVHDVHSS